MGLVLSRPSAGVSSSPMNRNWEQNPAGSIPTWDCPPRFATIRVRPGAEASEAEKRPQAGGAGSSALSRSQCLFVCENSPHQPFLLRDQIMYIVAGMPAISKTTRPAAIHEYTQSLNVQS